MAVSLSDHFTIKKLTKFVLPSILMMIVTSAYSVVDGYFISNFAGKNAFAAVNLIMPVLMALGAFGFMIGTGGSALVAFTLGFGEKKKANQIFSMLIELIVIIGIILSVVGFIFMPQLATLLKASDLIFDDCVLYGRILIIALPFFMLQNSFQSFLVVAEKANMGFRISVAAGLLNVFLDFLLVGVLKGEILGAAMATLIAQIVGGGIPLVYFLRKNKSLLRLESAKLDYKSIIKACTNGSSEMITNLSTSFVGIMYNLQLIRYAQENGVAAYGVVMYVSFIFMAIYFGYAIGVTPVIGYNYGAQNHYELKNLFKKSIYITAITAIVMTTVAEVFSDSIAKIFVGYDAELMGITKNAMMIYSFSFMLSWFNIFASAFFTGLGDGLLSAIISILRTMVIQVACIYILPLVWGINGVWAAIVVAEGITLVISIVLILINRKKYHYL